MSGADQSNELSMLDDDDGNISPDSPQGINYTIRVFRSFSAWIVHSSTPQKYKTAITQYFHIIIP